MSIFNKIALILLMLLLSAAAHGDGIYNPGSNMGFWGGDGITGGGAASSPVVGCVGTGFNFTLACNSQYLAVF